MDLFERFSSKENLKKAFLYLKDEAEKSSLPLDPIWRPSISAVTQLGDEFFEALQTYLREGKYKPDKADFIYADKGDMGVRPISVLSVVDRIIFQAILNPLILGNVIDKKLYNYSLGNRISGKDTYLKPYQIQWAKFCDNQVEAFSKNLIWRAEFDIQSFYKNIHIDTLINVLKNDFSVDDERLINVLEQQLKSWAENSTLCGLPQGANASHVLANAYLYPLDIFIDSLRRDFDYFRYVDDTIIMAKNADTINSAISKITIFLRKYNLELNSKSKLEKLKNTDDIEERKFYNPYGQVNETSTQKLAKLSKKVPPIVKKIIDGKDVKKVDIGGLNYYLKAMEGWQNPDFVDNLIRLIPKKPSFTFLVCRYLGLYFSDSINFFELGEKNVFPKYEKVWKIYSENSLTEWTKFWLFKVLSAPAFARSHQSFQREIDKIIVDPNAKFLRPLAFFYRAYAKEQIDPFADLGFTLDDIKRHIRNAKTETEKAVYYYFIIYLEGVGEDETIKELLYEAMQSKSPEIQTMGLFLVKKLYHLFEMSPATINERGVVTKMNIKMEREATGDLCRIYFKLPPIETQKYKPKEAEGDYLTFEGKIAKDQFTHLLGIPKSKSKFGYSKSKTHVKGGENYKIEYKNRQIILNDKHLINKFQFEKYTDYWFDYIYKKPNETITLGKIKKETKFLSKAKKDVFHKFLNQIKFKGELRKLFFDCSKDKVKFYNPAKAAERSVNSKKLEQEIKKLKKI